MDFDRFMGVFGAGGEKPAGRWLVRSQGLIPANAAEHRQLGARVSRIHGFGWLILASIWPRRRSTKVPSWSHVEPDAFGVTPIRYQPGRN